MRLALVESKAEERRISERNSAPIKVIYDEHRAMMNPIPIRNDYEPGSLVLTHRPGIYSAGIVWGQQLRFRGERRKYAHWSHAAIIVASDGRMVEALEAGVELNHVSKYATRDTRIIHTTSDPLAASRVVNFAMHSVGRHYNNAEIACLASYLATGTQFRFGIDNEMICSGLAASALSRTDAIFPHEPVWMLPADLAEYYDVV